MKKEQLWSYFFNMFANQDQFVIYQVKTKPIISIEINYSLSI